MGKKRAKKFCSILLSLCLIFAMASIAFADENGEIDDDDVLEVEKIIQDTLGETPSDLQYDLSDNPTTEPDNPSTEIETEDNGETVPTEVVSADEEIYQDEPGEEQPADVTDEPSDEPDPEKDVEPEEIISVDNPFTDVKADDYFFTPVLWAVENEITKGKYYNSFAPNLTCNRAEAVTFLWRANGKPEPQSYKHSFKDIESSAYYYKAVLWATENGITDGTSATTFDPYEKCSRGQIVTFLYRMENSDDVEYSFTDRFTDVLNDAYYAQPVSWAVDNKITEGTSETTFSPDDFCTRAQIVTFLYRAFA